MSHIPDLKLFPWHEDSALPPVSTWMNFPKEFTILKFYLQGVYPRSKGGTLYGRIRLSSTLPIMENIRYIYSWMKQNEHGLFPRAIQAEETTTLGWHLYYSLSTDQDHLSRTLSSKSGVTIACRFRKITQNRSDKGAPVKAIHLESSSQESGEAKKFLSVVYGRQSSSPYPTGAMYKLMPTIQSILIVIQRQSHFINHVKTIRTWQFTSIDYRHPELQLTLREMLANITWKDPSGNLSTTDPIHIQPLQKRRIHFISSPKNGKWSESISFHPLSYIRHVYGEKVNSLFTEDTASSQSNYHWDPNIGGAVTDDDELIKSVAGDDWMDFTPGPEGDTTEVCNMEAITTIGKYPLTRYGLSKSDSVWTIHTNTNLRSSMRNKPSSPVDNSSIFSSVTMESRMQTMESEVGSISGMVKEIYKALHPNTPTTSSTTSSYQKSLSGTQ